jgi:hypothetical protein
MDNITDRTGAGQAARKTPPSILHGDIASLTAEERRLEVRDILLAALHRWKAAQNNPQIAHNELDINRIQSVHASR